MPVKTFRSKGMPTYRAESGQGMGSFKVGDIVCSPRDGDVIGTVASWDTTTSKFVVIVAPLRASAGVNSDVNRWKGQGRCAGGTSHPPTPAQ